MWRLTGLKVRHFAALAIFVPSLLTALYLIEKNSEPYEAAERFLATDARVAMLVGPVKRIDFKFWDGFEVLGSSNGGNAHYTFEVTGGKGLSIVKVSLRSSSGVWRVVTADARPSDGPTLRIIGFGLAPSVVGFVDGATAVRLVDDNGCAEPALSGTPQSALAALAGAAEAIHEASRHLTEPTFVTWSCRRAATLATSVRGLGPGQGGLAASRSASAATASAA